MSPQMRTALESCAVAAKSADARDQYFAVAMVAEVAPDAHACKKKGVAFSKKGKSREGSSRRLLGAAELAEQKALFDEAKQTILSARHLLQK